MPAWVECFQHRPDRIIVSLYVLQNADTSNHVVRSGNRTRGILVFDMKMTIHHALRPVIPDVVDCGHHGPTSSDQIRKGTQPSTHIEDSLWAVFRDRLKNKPVLNGPFVDPLEGLSVELGPGDRLTILAPGRMNHSLH